MRTNNISNVSYPTRFVIILALLGVLLFEARSATWSRQYPPLTGDSLLWATHGLDGFVVVGNRGDALVSSNGLDWVLQPFGFPGPVAYNRDRFFWGGRGFVLVSTQGYYGFAEFRTLPFFGASPNQCYGIASASNTCVIVGEHGSIYLSSNDGDSWQPVTAQPFFPQGPNLISVRYGAPGFVAITGGNTVLHSTMGNQWSIRTNLVSNGSAISLNALAFGGDRFVAVGNEGKVAVSTNGTNWVVNSVPFDEIPGVPGPRLTTVVWLGSNFLAGASSGALYSSGDGLNWAELPERLPSAPYAITAWTGQIVFAGAGGTISVSTNGQPFIVENGPHPGPVDAMTFAQGQWVAIGQKTALRSTDGLEWTPIPNLTNGTLLNGVFHAEGRWFVPTSSGVAWTSTNAVDWELQSGDCPLSIGTPAFGNGVLVAGRQAIIYSTNRLDWFFADHQQPVQFDVAFFNGRFVAIGSDVLISTNGRDWTPQGFITNGYLSAITVTPEGLFVAGLSYAPPFNGVFFARSADGIQWTIETVGSRLQSPENIVTHLAWGRGLYVARIGGRPMTSRDGRHWEAHYFAGGMIIKTLRFGGGAFLAAGEGETIFRSEYVPPALGPAALQNGLLTFPLYTEAGATNYLEMTGDFETWTPLAPIVATNAIHRVVRPTTGGNEFLRVR